MKIKNWIEYGIEENLIDLIYEKVTSVILWRWLYSIYVFIYYDTPQFTKRMICHWKGCKVKGGYGGFNLPPQAYSYWCERCWATESNYEGDSKHEIIYK